jgi:plastocyanin domain-containing protein
MKKLVKISLMTAIAASAVFFAACGGAKNETATTQEKPEIIVENFAQPLKITVSKNGFEPKSIGVKKGEAVKLAFIRTDAENCGEEIVFPKQNIKKPLPLNETVPVEFTPSESGEIAFTCGMDMLRGKILVQ